MSNFFMDLWYSITNNKILQILDIMKNFLLFFFLSMTIASSANADGADDWQDVGFNTDILNQLNQCKGCDLRSTNFIGVNLSGANLSGANFEGSSLFGSSFDGSNLENTSFFAANLFGVTLKEAWLIGADLRQADLSKADLTLANLTGANLTNANLRGAILNGTIFCNTKTPWGLDNSSCE